MKAFTFAVVPLLFAGPCRAEFSRTITLAPDISADVEGFPTLIQISDQRIFAAAMAHGEDLVFLDHKQQKLPFEIVSWDPQRNTSEIWVRVPTLRSAAKTTIYLHYGAHDAPENRRFQGYRKPDVWGDDFDLVLHAHGERDRFSSSTRFSSGVPSKVVASRAGVVGEALAFNGVNSVVELMDLRHVDRWMTPVEKLGEYPLPRPQGLANDGRHLYFASHHDPEPADILKISVATGEQLQTFRAVGPVHSAGGDYWGANQTLVFSTGGSTRAAQLREITLAGQPVRDWNMSKVGYGKGALCAWKGGNHWLLLTSANSKFRINEVELGENGGFRTVDEWEAPVSLGIPQGMDYFDGHIYYYTDGGAGSRSRSPALITKLRLDPARSDVQYVDQCAILIDNHEAEGLTILDNGTVFVGDAKQGRAELLKVGARVDDLVSTFKDFTVSLWFKQRGPGASSYPTLIAKGSSVDNRNAFILHTMDYGAGLLKVKFGMTAPQWFGIVSDPVGNEAWHHAVGVYDHAKGVEFYLDGVLVGRRPLTLQHTIVDHRVPATLGADVEFDQRAHFFPGLIDEIRIARFPSSVSRIRAAHQNVAAYGDLVIIGPEQPVPAK